MHLTHFIVDDFLKDPMAVRKQALSLDYPPRPDGVNYPGRNASTALAFPDVEKMVGSIVHEPLVPVPSPRSSHGFPRLASDGDTSSSHVHIDNFHWSGILYLTPDEHCQGGTHFYRHNKTGWDMAPVWPGMAEKAGYADARTAMTEILSTDIYDADKWTETMVIPMKFNRLVLFRGYLWHDAGVSFGTTPEDSRLIVPLFFANTSASR